MTYVEAYDIRWTIWMGVFSSLQNVIKKDKDDTDGVLYALYPEFRKQVQQADFEMIVRISVSIPLSEKKFNGIFCSKVSYFHNFVHFIVGYYNICFTDFMSTFLIC